LTNCSDEAVDLCKRMMSYREDDRPTARECLNHPWFQLAPEKLVNSLSEEQTRALSAFATKSAFEKTVMLQVATIVRVADIPKVTRLFETLDINSAGHLDRSSCAKALIGLGFPAEEAAAAAAGLDLDGNNKIEYSELVAGIMAVYEEQTHNLLWGAFSQIDVDNNGVLDVKEVKQLLMKGELRKSGLMPPESEIEKMVESMDKDQSGKISFDEFKAFMTGEKKV
jgi:calcium-dependent protein kinase